MILFLVLCCSFFFLFSFSFSVLGFPEFFFKMEQRKKVTKLVVSPSLAVPNAAASGSRSFHQELAGPSYSGIVAGNFWDPISSLKAQKQELMEQSTNLLVSTSLAANASAACIRNFRLELARGSSSQIVSDRISDLESPISESMAFNAVQNPSYKLSPLPDLLSLEHHAPDPFAAPPLSISSGHLFSVVESSNKRFRPSSTPADSNPIPFSIPISGSRLTRSNEIGRQRRSKISERVTILEGLMPWKCKMARGPMLEEAHKYIKFLEAQVTALQTMPVQSARLDDRGGRMKFGELEMLNRQQMLQVMMNSSMVQDLIYKKGCCVFSEEQVALLRHKMAMAASSSASN